MNVEINYQDPGNVLALATQGKWSPLAAHQLSVTAHTLALAQRYSREDIETRHRERIQILPHQIDSALAVLNTMRGRAILADEVGLGKTIETGIILTEWHARGQLPSALVLTPASLVGQWRQELREKFRLTFRAPGDTPSFRGFESEPFIVVSVDTAKRNQAREALTARRWSAVVVDEAHKLRNSDTQAFKFARELQSDRLLLP